MKKITVFVLTLSLMLSLAATAYATNGDFDIEQGVLTKYTGKASHVTVPDSVTAIGSMAFGWCDTLTSVTLPDSVTSIGKQAFDSCTNLAQITLSNKLTVIGDHAFNKCQKLTSIDIPEGVTTIERCAFQQCYNLTEVTLPTSLRTIGNEVFSECKKLDSVTIPEGVTTIGHSVFYRCDSLTEVYLPASLTNLSATAFVYCSALTDIYYAGSEAQWNDIYFETAYGDGTLDTAATVHFLGSEQTDSPAEEVKASDKFGDVKPGAYYEAAVDWAVANGITDGTTDTTFSPDETCTRAQIITFLYRKAGCPKVTYYGQVLFEDVKESDWYYEAVRWAVSEGIVDQIEGLTHFRSSSPCTRADTVLFMWRAAGYPYVSGTNSFEDVVAEEYLMYQMPINWAVEAGITDGTSDTTFSPDDTCTRAQIVTLLHRSLSA